MFENSSNWTLLYSIRDEIEETLSNHDPLYDPILVKSLIQEYLHELKVFGYLYDFDINYFEDGVLLLSLKTNPSVDYVALTCKIDFRDGNTKNKSQSMEIKLDDKLFQL